MSEVTIMTPGVDVLVARVVLQARLLESAVHGTNEWTMTCGEQTSPAQRFRTDGGVTFLSDFSREESKVDGEVLVSLAYQGQTLGVRSVEITSDPFTVRWVVTGNLVYSEA